MKAQARIVIPILAVVLVALAFALWWMFGHADTLPASIVRGNGRLEMTRTDIAAKYPGRLMSLAVHEGDLVRAGQVIAQQDDVDLKAQLAGALAKREQAVSALMRAQGELVARDSQAELARIDWIETTKLRDRDMVSNVELEQRRLALGAARGGAQAAGGGVGEARSAIAQADAQIEQTRAGLADLRIIAPTPGRVEYRIVEPGTMLPPGGKIVSLVNADDVWLTVFLPASVAGAIRVGDEARILPQGFRDPIPARVSFVAPDAQFTPKFVETASERENLSYRVKLQIAPDIARRLDGKLKAGMTADGFVRTDTRQPWPDLTTAEK